jgi:hypothetical protein
MTVAMGGRVEVNQEASLKLAIAGLVFGVPGKWQGFLLWLVEAGSPFRDSKPEP